MGNSESNASIKALHANYAMIRYIKDDYRYGEGRLVRDKHTKQELFQKELNLTDEDKFKALKIMLEKKEVNNFQNLVSVVKLYYHEDSQFCGQFYKIYILMEYIPLSFYDLFEQKLAKKQQFTEAELWLNLIGCIEALSTLQSQNITHQGIRPETICYIDQQPYVKLVDPTISGVLSSFQQVIQDDSRQANNSYLSPQLMQSLNEDIQPIHNPFKSDVYSLGMVMLHATTLTSCEECYDIHRFRVQHQLVQKRLSQLESSFSPQYVQVLRSMLLLNEEQRPDFIQLKQELMSMSPPGSPVREINPVYEEEVIIETRKSQAPVQVQAYQSSVESFAIPQPVKSNITIIPPEQSAKFPQSVHNSQVVVQKSQTLRQSMATNQSVYIQQNGIKELRPDLCDHLKILPLSEQFSDVSNPDSNVGNQIGVEELLNNSDEHQENLMPITAFDNSQQYQQFQQLKQSNTNNMPVSYDSYKIEQQSHSIKKTAQQFPQENMNVNSQKYDYLYDKQLSNQEKLSNYQNDLKKNFEPFSNKLEEVTELYPNGSRYEGQKLNGMRHGQGCFFYQDNGGVYEGQWYENKMHGQGTLFYASGKPAYEGQWVNDKFEGRGTLYNEEPQQLYGEFDFRDFDQVGEFWTKYVGMFHEDNKEGQGTLHLSNGERFEGIFLQDLVSGPGKHYKKNGQIVQGRWWRNKLQQ